jgi:hypothetical protein
MDNQEATVDELLTCLPYGMLSAMLDVFSRWRRSGGRQDAKSASGEEYIDVVVVIPEVVFRIPELLTTLDATKQKYLSNHKHHYSAHYDTTLHFFLHNKCFQYYVPTHKFLSSLLFTQ